MIGVYDSGVGGLSVWRELVKTLNGKKQRFLQEVVPKWIDEAKKNGKVAN